jgi:hypothetical protein
MDGGRQSAPRPTRGAGLFDVLPSELVDDITLRLVRLDPPSIFGLGHSCKWLRAALGANADVVVPYVAAVLAAGPGHSRARFFLSCKWLEDAADCEDRRLRVLEALAPDDRVRVLVRDDGEEGAAAIAAAYGRGHRRLVQALVDLIPYITNIFVADHARPGLGWGPAYEAIALHHRCSLVAACAASKRLEALGAQAAAADDDAARVAGRRPGRPDIATACEVLRAAAWLARNPHIRQQLPDCFFPVATPLEFVPVDEPAMFRARRLVGDVARRLHRDLEPLLDALGDDLVLAARVLACAGGYRWSRAGWLWSFSVSAAGLIPCQFLADIHVRCAMPRPGSAPSAEAPSNAPKRERLRAPTAWRLVLARCPSARDMLSPQDLAQVEQVERRRARAATAARGACPASTNARRRK